MPLSRLDLIVALVAAVTLSCSGVGAPAAPPCLTDADCAGGNVCFVDGCGDPTRGIAAEVTGGSTVGLFPQDFEIPMLGTSQDFELKGPTTIVGSFQRERTANVDPNNRSIYTDEVLVRATGESLLLPGVARSYQSRFAMTDRGTFALNVGQGKFTVTAFPTNLEVPPQTFREVMAGPDAGSVVNFAFASVEGAVTLSGRLIKKKVTLPTPGELYITQAAMDLQAFNPATGEPLSQRVEVSTGRPGARGDFILVMSPDARTLPLIELVATPRELGSAVPSRRFSLSFPFANALTLELGDYGDEITGVPGVVLGTDGEPLAGASVLIEGRVVGGSTFRSKVVTTDEKGVYVVNLLAPETTYTLTVTPPPGVRSAVTQQQVKVKNAPGTPPTLDPPSVRCGERLSVTGSVTLPDGPAAANLAVRAVEVAASTTKRPLPLDDVETLTGVDGKYELRLDPGSWRLEFMPVNELPQTSRLITVSPAAAADGGEFPGQSFAPITLPRGRRLTGIVSSSVAGGSSPLINAQVRFFRLTTIEGKRAAVLLGTGITNSAGAYSVILPTREPSKQ